MKRQAIPSQKIPQIPHSTKISVVDRSKRYWYDWIIIDYNNPFFKRLQKYTLNTMDEEDIEVKDQRFLELPQILNTDGKNDFTGKHL